jgi:ankyrin repeat protein
MRQELPEQQQAAIRLLEQIRAKAKEIEQQEAARSDAGGGAAAASRGAVAETPSLEELIGEFLGKKYNKKQTGDAAGGESAKPAAAGAENIFKDDATGLLSDISSLRILYELLQDRDQRFKFYHQAFDILEKAGADKQASLDNETTWHHDEVICEIIWEREGAYGQELKNKFLFNVAKVGRAEQIDRLLKAGADVNLRNDDGLTPLMVAAGRDDSISGIMVAALIDAGAIMGKVEFDEIKKFEIRRRYFQKYINKCLVASEDKGILINEGSKFEDFIKKLRKLVPEAIKKTDMSAEIGGGAGVNPQNFLQFSLREFYENEKKKPGFSYDATFLKIVGYFFEYIYHEDIISFEQVEAKLGILAHKTNLEKMLDHILKVVLSIEAEKLSLEQKLEIFFPESMAEKANKELIEAIKSEDIYTVQCLLKEGVDINKKNVEGRTPLIMSATKGHKAIAEILIKAGADVNQANKYGATALFTAAAEGHTELVELLIAAGADVNKATKYKKSPLLVAAENGNAEVVKKLIAAGADSSVLWKETLDGKEAIEEIRAEIRDFHAAVKIGDLPTINLENNYLLNALDAGGNNPLIKAIRDLSQKQLPQSEAQGQGFLVFLRKAKELRREQLNKLNRQLQSRDAEDRSILHHGADVGNLELLKSLIAMEEFASAIDKKDVHGLTPLLIAAERGHADIVEELLAAGVEAREFLTHDGSKYNKEVNHIRLLTAVKGDNLGLVEALLKQGVEVTIDYSEQQTPLGIELDDGLPCEGTDEEEAGIRLIQNKIIQTFRAAFYGVADCVQLEKEQRYLANVRNKEGKTALIIAAENEHADVVKELLKQGADVELFLDMNFDDKPAIREIQNAMRCFVHLLPGLGRDVLSSMIEQDNYLINVCDKQGETALFKAVREGNIGLIAFLLDQGADVNKADGEGITPLFIAVGRGQESVVQALLNAGADTNQAMDGGYTPFLDAAENGHKAVVAELLAAGADVNKADDNGHTPLYFAALHGHADVVRQLLGAGATVDRADQEGETPLFIAAFNGRTDVVRQLLESGAVLTGYIYDAEIDDFLWAEDEVAKLDDSLWDEDEVAKLLTERKTAIAEYIKFLLGEDGVRGAEGAAEAAEMTYAQLIQKARAIPNAVRSGEGAGAGGGAAAAANEFFQFSLQDYYKKNSASPKEMLGKIFGYLLKDKFPDEEINSLGQVQEKLKAGAADIIDVMNFVLIRVLEANPENQQFYSLLGSKFEYLDHSFGPWYEGVEKPADLEEITAIQAAMKREAAEAAVAAERAEPGAAVGVGGAGASSFALAAQEPAATPPPPPPPPPPSHSPGR